MWEVIPSCWDCYGDRPVSRAKSCLPLGGKGVVADLGFLRVGASECSAQNPWGPIPVHVLHIGVVLQSYERVGARTSGFFVGRLRSLTLSDPLLP